MSGEPFLALLLLGMGLDEFSMTASSMLQIKKLIRSVNFKDAKNLAEQVLSLPTAQEVEELSKMRLKEWAPNVFNSGENK